MNYQLIFIEITVRDKDLLKPTSTIEKQQSYLSSVFSRLLAWTTSFSRVIKCQAAILGAK